MSKQSELDNIRPIPASHENGQTERLARLFHDTYERLAPEFGYETREETKQFDPELPNGKLMIAVCGEFLDWHNKQIYEARLNEVQSAYEYWINGRKFISSYFRDRIAELSQTLKEHKEAEL